MQDIPKCDGCIHVIHRGEKCYCGCAFGFALHKIWPPNPDINGIRQNHPELVARDLEKYVPKLTTRRILKERGVNKWLKNRRLIIQLKDRIKQEIKDLETKKKQLNGIKRAKTSGRIEALIDIRQQLRAICHSNRDTDFPHQVSDFGECSILPEDFPKRPSANWLLRKERKRIKDAHNMHQ